MKFPGDKESLYSTTCLYKRLPANCPTHSTIQIADTTFQNYRITARFRDGEDLATILSVLHNAGYFNYSQNNKQIIITAKPD